jgi:hypothetical protein
MFFKFNLIVFRITRALALILLLISYRVGDKENDRKRLYVKESLEILYSIKYIKILVKLYF